MTYSPNILVGKGNRLPTVRKTLQDEDGDLYNLTGRTVKFHWRLRDSAVVNEGTCTVIGSAENGVADYAWQAGDTDTAGDYVAWFTITLGAIVMDVPNSAARLWMKVTDPSSV